MTAVQMKGAPQRGSDDHRPRPDWGEVAPLLYEAEVAASMVAVAEFVRSVDTTKRIISCMEVGALGEVSPTFRFRYPRGRKDWVATCFEHLPYIHDQSLSIYTDEGERKPGWEMPEGMSNDEHRAYHARFMRRQEAVRATYYPPEKVVDAKPESVVLSDWVKPVPSAQIEVIDTEALRSLIEQAPVLEWFAPNQLDREVDRDALWDDVWGPGAFVYPLAPPRGGK